MEFNPVKFLQDLKVQSRHFIEDVKLYKAQLSCCDLCGNGCHSQAIICDGNGDDDDGDDEDDGGADDDGDYGDDKYVVGDDDDDDDDEMALSTVEGVNN